MGFATSLPFSFSGMGDMPDIATDPIGFMRWVADPNNSMFEYKPAPAPQPERKAPPPMPPPPPFEWEAGEPVALKTFRKVAFLNEADVQNVPIGFERNEAQQKLVQAIFEYLNDPYPDSVFVAKCEAGFGKTYLAAMIAEAMMLQKQWRVFFASPFIGAFEAVSREGQRPEDWYNWQARFGGEDGNCHYASYIDVWMRRGHKSTDFCSQKCGFAYMKNDCRYHAQKEVSHRIIFGRHQHVFLSHPLFEKCSLLIGDELPLQAVTRQWDIPARFIVPTGEGETPQHPGLIRILQKVKALAETGQAFAGTILLEKLGGAQNVFDDLTSALAIDSSIRPQAPPVTDDSDEVPYRHALLFAKMLSREAEVALTGADYIERVIVAGGELRLVTRRYTPHTLPNHIIWLDATADERAYEQMFGKPAQVVSVPVNRRGRLYQIHNAAYNKNTMIDYKTGKETDKVGDIRQMIDRIVKKNGYDIERVGVVTFKALTTTGEDGIERFGPYKAAHFGGSRGINTLDNCHLFVVGTPMPSPFDIEKTAKALFFDRMEPFNNAWTEKLVPYPNHAIAYPTSGYWDDPDLQTVLELLREGELEQAIHRGRINNNDVDCWLFSNLPLRNITPDAIMSNADVLGVPSDANINTAKWIQFVNAAESIAAKNGFVLQKDLIEETGLNKRTVIAYWKFLGAQEEWEVTRISPEGSKGGPKPEILKKRS